MTKLQWKDATSYSRGERGTVPPRTYATTVAGEGVAVTCGHIYYPGQWILRSPGLGVIEPHPFAEVADMTPEQAQDAALKLLNRRIAKIAKALSAAVGSSHGE